MPRTSLESLGAMVKVRRGARRLRAVATEMGIGVDTAMAVDNGRMPDVATFGNLCQLLNVEPWTFLGFENRPVVEGSPVVTMSAHLKSDPNPNPDTVRALAQMLSLIAKTQA